MIPCIFFLPRKTLFLPAVIYNYLPSPRRTFHRRNKSCFGLVQRLCFLRRLYIVRTEEDCFWWLYCISRLKSDEFLFLERVSWNPCVQGTTVELCTYMIDDPIYRWYGLCHQGQFKWFGRVQKSVIDRSGSKRWLSAFMFYQHFAEWQVDKLKWQL